MDAVMCVFWFFLCQSIPGSSASQLVCCVCGGQVPGSWLEETIITTRSVQYVHAFSVCVIPCSNILAESHPCIAVLTQWSQKSEVNIASWCTYWLIKVTYLMRLLIYVYPYRVGSHLSQHAGIRGCLDNWIVVSYLWLCQVEIERYSVAYFNRITAYVAL